MISGKRTAKTWEGGFKYVWNQVINIGITEATPLFDRKRARLLNGIAFSSLVANLCYVFSIISLRVVYVAVEAAAGSILYALVIFLNYLHKVNTAAHVLMIGGLLYFLTIGILNGGIDAAEYFLLACAIVSGLFFRQFSIIVGYFLLSGLAFAVCRYFNTYMQPLFSFPGEEYFAISNHVILFIMTFLVVYYFRAENTRQEQLLEKRNNSLIEEKRKSEVLLYNILPEETAEELKANGNAAAKMFQSVTVMFTDFKDFTIISQTMSPAEVVAEINECFSMFDTIIDKYGLEKIKTIGDAYMCAGGLPRESITHAQDMVSAALEIIEFMEVNKSRKQAQGKPYYQVRIGVHTGPVVAGIVGTRKFAYDIWGDTVNTASRMESCSDVGKINISGDTHTLISGKFQATYRGKIEAKSKGMIDMYFVEGYNGEK